LAIGVAEAQTALSGGIILFSGFAIPLHRFHLILHHASAIGVADAQTALSIGVILLGGFAIPLHRLDLILRHALAIRRSRGPDCH
jgi:uncharacterized protein (UPF0248 family)